MSGVNPASSTNPEGDASLWKLAAAIATRAGLLDEVAERVLALGYTPAECLIETVDPPVPIRGLHVRTDRLKVRDTVAFQVVTETSYDEGQIRVRFRPMLVFWPAAKQTAVEWVHGEEPECEEEP